MVVYLNVFKRDKTLGTLEIGKNASSGDIAGLYFEWRGQNGTNDGGIWEWAPDEYGIAVMKLTSNQTQNMVVELWASNWKGADPPQEPWFKRDSEGQLWYYLPTSDRILARWKIL